MLQFYLSMIDTPEKKAKFEELYKRYHGLLISRAYDILRNGQDAEDAVHQAFMRLIPNMDKLEEIECPKTKSYLIITVERVCIDQYNKRKKIVQIPYEDIDESKISMAQNDDFTNIEYTELLAKVNLLPDMYADILYLKYCEGYSTKEISESMGITTATARKRLERARDQLQFFLSNEEKITV